MNQIFHRHWLQAALIGTAIALAGSVQAQNYPSKPIRLVVPFTPGGVTDTSGRLIAEQLSKRLGQQVIVDNKPGAGGTLGGLDVVRAPADGYTLLLATSSTHAIGPSFASASGKAYGGPTSRSIAGSGRRAPCRDRHPRCHDPRPSSGVPLQQGLLRGLLRRSGRPQARVRPQSSVTLASRNELTSPRSFLPQAECQPCE